jgi:hypothetical protein
MLPRPFRFENGHTRHRAPTAAHTGTLAARPEYLRIFDSLCDTLGSSCIAPTDLLALGIGAPVIGDSESPEHSVGIADNLHGCERGWTESSPPSCGACGVWRARILSRRVGIADGLRGCERGWIEPKPQCGFDKLLKYYRFSTPKLQN